MRRLLLACLGMVAVVILFHQMNLPTLLFLPIAIGGGGLVFVTVYIALGGRELQEILHTLRHS